MKTKLFLTLLLLICFQISYAQNEANKYDFVEIGIRSSRFLKSDFLNSAKYSDQIADPEVAIEGLMPVKTGSSFGINIKYGKGLNAKTHLIMKLGYAQREEQVICFCHICDKAPETTTLVTVNSFDLGVGARYLLMQRNDIDFQIEGSTIYSIAEGEMMYLGYYIAPMLGFKMTENIMMTTKVGFEQSFGKYSKMETFAEVGVGVRL